jgi:hypothetical protein
MVSVGLLEAKTLRNQWDEAYGWLPKREREGLSLLFALSIIKGTVVLGLGANQGMA